MALLALGGSGAMRDVAEEMRRWASILLRSSRRSCRRIVEFQWFLIALSVLHGETQERRGYRDKTGDCGKGMRAGDEAEASHAKGPG